MRAYTDLFGKKLTKHDVTLAASIVARTGNPYAHSLRRYTKFGFGKASRIIKVLRDAKVVSTTDVILKKKMRLLTLP